MSYQLIIGECIDVLPRIPDGSVNCCVTSPPYFGLRDYGVDGQIGLELTPEQYVAKMVEVFREVRRVLRDDGTLWLNIGDSYVGATSQHKDGGSQGHNSCIAKKTMSGIPQNGRGDRNRALYKAGIKMKDLIGIPWMLAFALRADGWYLRQEIIWHKPNPMPESVKDRCTKAHEQVFLLSKSARYYFDSEAMKEDAVDGSGKRNRRSVWSVATRPYKGAHFATFPPALIEPCILAGCPADGVVLDPFGGSGTTAGVAVAHGRDAIICELNPEYGQLVPDRVASILKSIQAAK